MSMAYANPDDLPSYIEVTPGVCGGKPCIVGSRIRVQDIVAYFRIGQPAEEIFKHYPQLSLVNIHAALAYYFDNQATIDAQMKEGLTLIKEVRRSFPSKLPTKRKPEK